METWIVALSGVCAGATLGWGLTRLLVVDRLRGNLRTAGRMARAARDSQDDVLVLWTNDREQWRGDLRRMEERAIDAMVGEDIARAQVTMLRVLLDRAVKEREEARTASRLALTFYGAELTAREAAEAAADDAYGRLERAA